MLKRSSASIQREKRKTVTAYEGWSLDELFRKLSELQKRRKGLNKSLNESLNKGLNEILYKRVIQSLNENCNVFLIEYGAIAREFTAILDGIRIEHETIAREIEDIYNELERKGVFDDLGINKPPIDLNIKLQFMLPLYNNPYSDLN